MDELDELLGELYSMKKYNMVHTETGNGQQNIEGNPADADLFTTDPNFEPGRGDRVSVFWAEDQYYPGVISSENRDRKVDVSYDDGEDECLKMTHGTWNSLQASTGIAVPEMEIKITESHVLSRMQEHFGNKSFLRNNGQGFYQFPLISAFKKKEETFLKTVKQYRIPKYQQVQI